MPEDRYFQPSSQTTNTTLPSSISRAMRTAMDAIAPLETPAKTPSSSSRRVAVVAYHQTVVSRFSSSSTGVV